MDRFDPACYVGVTVPALLVGGDNPVWAQRATQAVHQALSR
jgi:hypothetical protein